MVQLGYTSARNIEKKQKTKGGDQAKAEDFTGDNVKSSETRGAEVVSLPVENLQIQSDDKGKASLPLVPDSTSEAKSTFFDWSRSLTSKVHSTGELRGYVHEATSIQSLLWTAYQKVLPSEITDDFRDTMECHGLPRMDWNMKGKPVKSAISVKANGTKYNLSGFELGPPSALAGMNYSKVTHKESNANNYVISYTTNRTVGEDEGRHFLFVKYGVKVPVRRNTLVVHRPTDPHGTTLPHRSPKEELDRSLESQQSGTGMLISNSLLNAWRKFKGETKEVFEAKKQELQKRRDAKSTLGGVREGSDSEETSDIEEEEEPL